MRGKCLSFINHASFYSFSVRSLEKAKSAGQYASASAAMDSSIFADDSASESSDTETLTQGRRKKQKTK